MHDLLILNFWDDGAIFRVHVIMEHGISLQDFKNPVIF